MNENKPGSYSYDGLDRVLHEKARLGILTSLFTHQEGLVFGEIKSLCSLTDGNLSRHLQVLEREDLVTIVKETGSGRPKTTVFLTDSGRQRFQEYLEELQTVLKAASQEAVGGLNPGFSPA
jgi:DNA-binding MarR family transcriptional regulator